MTVDLNDVGAIERELESEKEKEGFLDVVHRLFVASVRSEARSEFRSRKMTASDLLLRSAIKPNASIARAQRVSVAPTNRAASYEKMRRWNRP